MTAQAISAFLSSEVAAKTVVDAEAQPTYIAGAGFVGALALAEAVNLLSQ